MATNTYLSMITLNINGPNAPIKSFTVPNWIKKKARACNFLSIRNIPLG